MIPRLYLSDSTEFESNGEGLLKDIIECYVEEERNGLFDLTFKIPVGSFLFEKIEKGNIIKAHASDRLRNQLFRIDIITKPIDNIVIVYAKHISFDLDKDFIVKLAINKQSCEYVLNEIFRNSKFSKHFKGKSDIVNSQDYNIELASPLEAIVGKEGSIIDTFGNSADILRDNFTISVLNDRGKHNNVLLAYRKNITGFELVEDIENVVGDIYPYAEYSNENNETIRVTIDEEYVTSSRKVNYKFPTKILPKDFSEKFVNDEVPTQEKLRQLSKKYFTESKCDIPKLSYKIEFIPLSKTENYKEMKFLEDIGMSDKLFIWNSKYNIRDEAKVIKTKYNVLTEKYESIELGEPRTTLGDIVNRLPDQGPPGPPGKDGATGPQGKPGEEFPDSLPTTPIVTLRAGFDSIGISWTFESKVYYNYEVYASQTKDFNPNSFDLIFKGQSSAFLHEVSPNQTWYYRVCAINSYGSRTTFSEQVSATTTKIADGTEYFENAAITDALIADLRADRAWIGKFQGEYIDARNLSVTDGNGKRTLDIDSFGNVNLDVTSLKIKSTDVDKSLTEVIQTSKALELKVQGMQDKIGQDLIKNGNFSAGYSEWIVPFDGPISPSNCRIIEHGAIKYISQLEGKNPVLTIAQLDIPVKEKMAYTFKIALAGDKNTDKINCEVVISQNGVEWSKTNGDDTWGTLDKPGIWQTSYMSTAEGTISIKVVMWNLDGTNVYATDLILLEPGGDYATSQQVAELVIQSDRIEQKVSTLDKSTSSSITILNDQIKSKVDSNGVKSVIEQNPKSVQIGFNSINDTFSVTPNEVYMKGTDGKKHLRFYNGKMRVVHPDGSDFGYIGRNKWTGTDIYGMAIDMDYQTSFSVGFDEGMYYISSFACVKTPFYTDGAFLDKGVHVFEKFITHGAEFVGTQKITDINHPLGSGKGDVGIWTTLDMHNWGIKNTTITKDLKPQTIELKSHIEKNKLDCKTYMCDSSHKDTLIIKCDEIVSTVDNEVIVEIPQIFSENINDDYNIHIHKTTFGDYKIKEQNRYYFIVESDRDISFKWDILATKINADYNILTLANEPYMVEEPEQLVNCFADKPIDLIKELKENNELWKIYRK